MRGEVVFADIRLDLDDFSDAPDTAGQVDEPFSQQILCDDDGVAVIKVAWQLGHGGRLAQFPV